MLVNKYEVIVGLNDLDTKEQKYSTDFFIDVVKTICKGYRTAFSVSDLHGGYFHDDGTFVSENSLCITLFDVDQYTVEEIAKDICVFFHQESVVVARGEVDFYLARESIDKEFKIVSLSKEHFRNNKKKETD